MRGPETPGDRASSESGVPDDALTVAQLAGRIDGALRDGLPKKIKVVGEISNFNDRTHWYFALKDEDAVVSCVMFASAARRTATKPASGDRVLATGRVEFYPKQGRTQLYVERIEPIGAGELERRYRELVEELRGLGWFDPEAKQPLPAFPRRVAVITSRTSAALQDVIDTARRRCAAVELLVVDVRVQGDGSAAEVCRAIDAIGAHADRLCVDSVLLTRGGGSLEDLWSFNERSVAEAVRRCPLPVVAAIGHETDVTIAELVADERAATPTQAAMRLTPDRAALLEQLEQTRARHASTMRRRLAADRDRLRSAASRPLFADPAAALARWARGELDGSARSLASAIRHRVGTSRLELERAAGRAGRTRPEAVYAARRERLSSARHRLDHAVRRRLDRADPEPAAVRLAAAVRTALDDRADRLDALERELIVVGPANVLARGYSVTTDETGAAVRDPSALAPGARVRTRVARGVFTSRVEDERGGLPARPDEAAAPAPASLPARKPPRRRGAGRARTKRDDPDQLGLF